MRLSVLIVNWNTRDLLRACLRSVFANPPQDGEIEVIVVDNASSDESAKMVREEFPSAILVASEKNTGYARGNNLAFGRATGDWLLTLNPDTELEADTLTLALASLGREEKAGALGARLIGTDGETQASVRGFPTVTGIFGTLTGLDRLLKGSAFDSYRMRAFDYARRQPAPQPMGTFLLFRREALVAIGDPKAPFDEGFPIFFNEVDLLARLHRAGWSCLYDPDVRVKHLGGASTRQVRKSMIWESHRSLVRYLRKHTRGIGRLGLPLVSAVILAAAFVRAKGLHAGFRG